MTILDSAELLLQAKNYSGSGNWLDETANSHDGVNSGTLFKAHTGDNYVFLPGTASNTVSLADAAVLDLDGDFEIIARVRLDDWTPAATNTIVGKWGAGGALRKRLEALGSAGLAQRSQGLTERAVETQ